MKRPSDYDIEGFLSKIRGSFNEWTEKTPEIMEEVYEKYICFMLSEYYFSFPLSKVREILDVPRIEAIPGAPPFLLGIFNHRGDIFSVTEIHSVLGLKRKEIDKRSKLIITRNLPVETGLLVDSIKEVDYIRREDLAEISRDRKEPFIEYVAATFEARSHESFMLDIDKILGSPNLQVG